MLTKSQVERNVEAVEAEPRHSREIEPMNVTVVPMEHVSREKEMLDVQPVECEPGYDKKSVDPVNVSVVEMVHVQRKSQIREVDPVEVDPQHHREI